jgi:hypothetical protein
LQQVKEWYPNLNVIQPYFDEPYYVGLILTLANSV